jgi:hypothetical protein
MSNKSATSSGSPALRFGALFGLGWGVLLIANYYLVQSQGVSFLTLAALLISLVVYLMAALLAAAKTGKTSTGLVAGLWAGLFSSLLNAIGVMVLLLTDHALLEKVRQGGQNIVHVSATGASPEQLIIAYSAIILILGIVAATLVGLALGALGGVAGKSMGESRQPAPQAYRESLYPGVPPVPPASTPGASSPSSPGERD